MYLRTALRQFTRNVNFSSNTPLHQKYNQFIKNGMKPKRRISEQMEIITSLARENEIPKKWSFLISDIISKEGEYNSKNINAVLLKRLVNSKNLLVAKSLAEHLRDNEKELSMGTINSILYFYYNLSKQTKLTSDEISYVKNTYKDLYNKYKILDYETSEHLVNALCAIGNTNDALKVLKDIEFSSVPSLSTYGNVIASLFRKNRKEKALEMINRSIRDRKNLHDNGYKAWVDYVVRNGVNGKNILSGVEEICELIANKCLRINPNVARVIRQVYVDNLNWQGVDCTVTENGKCSNCNITLDLIQLTDEEFSLLQSKFTDQVLIGKDVFLKTSPEEIEKFMKFLEDTAPYDIVLDALNLFFAFNGSPQQKVNFVIATVKYFLRINKKILVLGRDHMKRWHRHDLEFLLRNTTCFFTDNLSQDDPFFLTAALFSGPQTDIITRDKLRGHRHLLADERLRSVFLRWQWLHQWMYRVQARGVPTIVKPLPFTPFAQKNVGWHLPYECDNSPTEDPMNAESPVPAHWLCLQPK